MECRQRNHACNGRSQNPNRSASEAENCQCATHRQYLTIQEYGDENIEYFLWCAAQHWMTMFHLSASWQTQRNSLACAELQVECRFCLWRTKSTQMALLLKGACFHEIFPLFSSHVQTEMPFITSYSKQYKLVERWRATKIETIELSSTTWCYSIQGNLDAVCHRKKNMKTTQYNGVILDNTT